MTQTGLYQGAVRRIMVDSVNSNLVFFGMASTGPVTTPVSVKACGETTSTR